MATFNSDIYAAGQPAGTGHGVHKSTQHLHAVVPLTTAMTTGDVCNLGYLPANAVVVGVVLKAQSQLDSSTGLTLSVGVSGAASLWMSAIATVGRATGVTSASTIATTGGLYKTPGKTLAIATLTAGPTTAVAGNLEVNISYFVEDAGGAQA